jgi:diguanylate cyclase (GGDEF)-like protein
VALLDVDHFKQINDRHSHAVGDLVLMQLAALIARQCREGDLPARYGGEEFLVRFHRIGLDGAAAACERLRAAVAAHDWASLAPGLAVTVSIGVVDLGRHGSVAAALAAADELMYRAKRGGRNRVCVDAGG